MYTYKTYIWPIIEYGSILFAHADYKLLKKIQAIETSAIKIAHRLPPWTTSFWCYQMVNFDNILDRNKSKAKNVINTNSNDELIKPLIGKAKPSNIGFHSDIDKALNDDNPI